MWRVCSETTDSASHNWTSFDNWICWRLLLASTNRRTNLQKTKKKRQKKSRNCERNQRYGTIKLGQQLVHRRVKGGNRHGCREIIFWQLNFTVDHCLRQFFPEWVTLPAVQSDPLTAPSAGCPITPTPCIPPVNLPPVSCSHLSTETVLILPIQSRIVLHLSLNIRFHFYLLTVLRSSPFM